MRVFIDRVLGRRAGKDAARRLYDGAVARGRQPELYAQLGVPDTVEGRFEMLTLHVILLIDRLGSEGAAGHLRQALFDVYVSNLDGALREMSVGDLAVGRRMKQLAQVFYGRALAFDAAFRALPDAKMLEDLVARTIMEERDGVEPRPLAAYIASARDRLEACETTALLEGTACWAAR